jgi:hypothetical protein
MNYRAVSGMSTGAVLITVGAILYFAVTATVQGFDVNAAGTILMIVGFVVALGALLWGMTDGMRARSHVVQTRRAAAPPAQQVVTERPQQVVVETRTVEDRPGV